MLQSVLEEPPTLTNVINPNTPAINPEIAKQERKAIFDLLDAGAWQIFGGHGGIYAATVPEKGAK